MPRPTVAHLASLGPLPDKSAAIETIATFEAALNDLPCPITGDQAAILVRLFGPDDCFALAWTLLHAIETAPRWPLRQLLENSGANEWVVCLRRRGAPT